MTWQITRYGSNYNATRPDIEGIIFKGAQAPSWPHAKNRRPPHVEVCHPRLSYVLPTTEACSGDSVEEELEYGWSQYQLLEEIEEPLVQLALRLSRLEVSLLTLCLHRNPKGDRYKLEVTPLKDSEGTAVWYSDRWDIMTFFRAPFVASRGDVKNTLVEIRLSSLTEIVEFYERWQRERGLMLFRP